MHYGEQDDLYAPLIDKKGKQGGHHVGKGHASRAHQIQSRVLQIPVKDIAKEAVSLFSSTSKDGNVPLVLIPEHRSWTSMTLSIPTGCACLLQKFGKDVGIAPPGLHWMPPYYRIAYVVTQQACTYQAPVKECPTKDNVRVGVDMVVVFMIRDPIAFIRRLGASQFDLMLSGCIQEGIRMLVRAQTFDTVYYLRGSRTESMISLLNQKFAECGIVFSNVTIRGVTLPPELAKSLEHTTELKKHMEKAAREQEFMIGEIKRESEMTLEELKRKLESSIVIEGGKKNQALRSRDNAKVKAEDERQVAVIQAQEGASLACLEASAALDRVKTEVERYRIEEISKANSAVAERRNQADIDFAKDVTSGESEKELLAGEAKAIRMFAAAEAENAVRYVNKRTHEIRMREREILADFAGSKSIRRIVGSQADELIDGLTTGSMKPKREEEEEEMPAFPQHLRSADFLDSAPPS